MGPLDTIIARAKSGPKHIVLAEGHDLRIVEAAVRAAKDGIAQITLLGDVRQTRKLTHAAGDIENQINISDPSFQNPLRFANEMVLSGKADGSVAGAVFTTSEVVRSAIKDIGLHQNYNLVSSLFLMIMKNPSKPFENGVVFSDCGLVIDPDAEQLADIASASVDTGEMLLGLEPKVAMLSFATGQSASHTFVDKIATATQLLKSKRPDLLAEGPIQFDAAILPEISAQKAPNSDIEGQANIFIFPDLNAGNLGYKIAERIGGAKAIGPILQGLKKPANDLSRGCDSEAVYNMIAITVLQAQAAQNG